MATGRGMELLEVIGAIAAALTEDSSIGWMAVMSAVAAGVETALDHMHEKEAK